MGSKKRAQKKAKSSLPPKYRNPETGKTWNGHGKRPFWLIGDRDKYLIAGQAETVGNAAKPQKVARTKAKSLSDWRSGAAKVLQKATARSKQNASPKQAGKRKTPSANNSAPQTDIPISPVIPDPAAPPVE
ncbi:MAG: H-NS histone family protein [Candidatus Accumulibacter sp.]|nr:H-NS histone family protein [Accumulibacter sp.]